MQAVWSLRVFPTDAPEEYETGGVISESENDSWNHTRCGVDRYVEPFNIFVDEEIESDDEPAPQRVYDGIAVVLEGVKFEVTEDDMTHVFR